ncbi:MAG: carboxymuconolactone decarboxylase family protein [Chitinophagaceae bacterium]
MRIIPLPPEQLTETTRHVHDEITKLIGRSQSPVKMLDETGALLGPFPPMLQYPEFGIPALTLMRALDTHATLDKRVREVAILTVAAAYGARFELYAHQIMAAVVGLSGESIAMLAAGAQPPGLSEQEMMAYIIASALSNGKILPDSTYERAVLLFGKDGVAELFFLIGGYGLLAVILNGYDMPAPDREGGS